MIFSLVEKARKKVIVLAGPTASGKSNLALKLAKKLDTEIINADSRQCYTELGVAVAKPSPSELREVPHHFINSHSFTEHVSAYDFSIFCERKVREILYSRDVVIVSGGTGLYLQAWLEGLSKMPTLSAQVRDKVDKEYAECGLDFLLSELARKNDPFLEQGNIQNPARVKRAYEVLLQTSKSILDFRITAEKPKREYKIQCFALAPEKSKLDTRIAARTQKMMQNGLVKDVMKFYPYKEHKNLKTVGYTEVYDAKVNKWDEDKIQELITIHTRQYAKRQMTWYKNKGNYSLLNPVEAEDKILLSLL